MELFHTDFPSFRGTALTAKHESILFGCVASPEKLLPKKTQAATTTQCHIRKINLFGAARELVVVRLSAFVSVFVEMNF